MLKDSDNHLIGKLIRYRLLAACLAFFPMASGAEDIDIYKSHVCSVSVESEHRFIFVVDNSGSMNSTEFNESKMTVDASIQHVLTKLPDAEVAVVQYGTDSDYEDQFDFIGNITPYPADHAYDISVPFTDDPTVAVNWGRKYAGDSYTQDHTPASLSMMRLDDVYAPGGALDITDGNVVQFVFFTDAERDDNARGCCSALVADSRNFINDEVLPGFGEYDALKNGSVLPGGIRAQFTVLNSHPDDTAKAAAAAIASVGGNYTKQVEASATDPDGSGITPRRYIDGSLNAANDVDKIVSLLDEVITQIKQPAVSNSDTFTAASIDVDRTAFSSENRAFYSLFVPSGARGWQGNLKGYFIGSNGLLDINGVSATVDAATGVQFKKDAQSFWSANPDGANVLAGGANEQVTANGSRNLYTFLDNENLGDRLQQRLEPSNVDITPAHLNVGTDAQRVEALNWIHAAPMGDSLHSSPVSVKYEGRTVLYSSTNQGVLHAFDATEPVANNVVTGGEELWGYVPKELLGNLSLLAGAPTSGSHIYGLDGAITRWHNDGNRDGIVNGNDTVLLVFGQRRGGRNYYALDVTDPIAPRFEWQITGGVSAGFDDLAQTWSQPALITVAHTGQAKTDYSEQDTQRVLVFAGGYDAAAYDGKNSATVSKGGAIYIVDSSGSLLWKSENEMGYSMPADLSVIDSDGDALADRIYAADLGGQIWRVDLADLANANGSKVTLLASIAIGGFQPFFYQPNVAYIESRGESFFSIAIGSGNRTEPLEPSTQNYLYMFKDRNIDKGPPADKQQVIKKNDLYDATNLALASDDASVRDRAQVQLDKSDGWKIKLLPGEKVLAESIVLESVLLVTTYRPTYAGNPSVCETSISSENRLYSITVGEGSPAAKGRDFTQPITNLNASDRSILLNETGIASTPIPVFQKDSDSIQILVGKDIEQNISQTLKTVFWFTK